MLRKLVDNLPAKTVLENTQYLGDLLLQTGQYEECETLCQRQLRSFPMAPAILLRLAQCSFEQGKFTRSEEFCNRTLTIPLREHLLYDSSMLMTKLMHRKKDLLRAKCYARIALPLAQLKYGKEEGDILYLRRVLQIGGT